MTKVKYGKVGMLLSEVMLAVVPWDDPGSYKPDQSSSCRTNSITWVSQRYSKLPWTVSPVGG